MYVVHDLSNADPILEGGGQEHGLRSGTENVLLMAGMGQACEIVTRTLDKLSLHMAKCTALLRKRLIEELGEDTVQFNGPSDPALRLPNTTSVSFKGVRGFCVVEQLANHVCISSGAACHAADQLTISYVLEAMGLSNEWAEGTCRISCGRHTTEGEIEQAVKYISAAVKKLRLIRSFIDKLKGVSSKVTSTISSHLVKQ